MENKNNFSPLDYKSASAKAEEIVKDLTLNEKIEMIGGHRFFFIKGIERHSIPELYLTDATQGVHLRKELDDKLNKSVAFPCPIALAATWNPELAKAYATSVGEECRAGGIGVLLAPGMNGYRISQNGRNFEYFGEDPYLASRMIENYVKGVQSTGVASTLKHFIANETEFHRRTSNSIVDERTLREIYMPPFKAGIEAGAMAVMTAYNKFMGEWCAENEHLIKDILRDELGFKWLVMSDWWSIWNPEKAMKSGLSLDMPGDGSRSDHYFEEYGDVYLRSCVNTLIKEGKACEEDVNRMVKEIVTFNIAMKFDKRELQDKSYLENFTQHEKIALQTAKESMVLLRNHNSILPLKPEIDNILVTGKFVNEIPAGLGSAEVEGYNQVTMLTALEKEFGNKISYLENPSDSEIGNAEIIILSSGTIDSECYDKPFALPLEEEEYIQKVASLNKNTIVVFSAGGGRQLTNWNNQAAAIVYSWYPGQNGFTALAEILSGKLNPSGKLPITIEKQFKDSPGYGYVPENAEYPQNNNDDINMRIPQNDIQYKEGVFVGYRWYEHKNIEPLYSFGFGLSYTSFEFSNLKAKVLGEKSEPFVKLNLRVTNTGEFKGDEIIQVYIKDIESSVPRPIKELKAFKRVSLNPNESKSISLELQRIDFAFWEPKTKQWTVEAGDFEILVGNASDNILLQTKITLD